MDGQHCHLERFNSDDILYNFDTTIYRLICFTPLYVNRIVISISTLIHPQKVCVNSYYYLIQFVK